MYDEVMVSCPNCHKINELQSKAGSCILAIYSLETVPAEILADLSKQRIYCTHCSKIFRIRVQYVITTEIEAILDDETDYGN